MTIHDFRQTTWGHNFDVKPQEDGSYKGFAWSTPAVRKGDRVIWETTYGHAVLEVTECHNYTDPRDMSRFTAKIVERYLSDGVHARLDAGEIEPPPWLTLTE